MVVVEDMELKDVQKLEEQFSKVPHVKDVLWYDDAADITLPVEMLPSDLRKAFFNGDATMMLALFDNTTSSDEAMNAVSQMREITDKQCFISGMTGVVTDIKNISLQELPIYIVIAVMMCFLVLELTSQSFLVPILFLFSIGVAILYNLGSNIFLGEISYITKALTAILQLGVTMDYSIFLLNSYEENKLRFPGGKGTRHGARHCEHIQIRCRKLCHYGSRILCALYHDLCAWPGSWNRYGKRRHHRCDLLCHHFTCSDSCF